MRSVQGPQSLVLENVWRKDAPEVHAQVLEIWREHGGPVGDAARDRLRQLVYVVKNLKGEVVGISTAFKTYVRQLRNHFYATRLMLLPGYRVPGLMSKLLVSTRDFLESVHKAEVSDPPIGIITVVENQRLKEHRNEAIWPASKMVYIGNSPEGHHIRVYYFKDARIVP